jgi:hypothetical protein
MTVRPQIGAPVVFAAALLFAPVGGCTEKGAVVLLLERPTLEQLDPLSNPTPVELRLQVHRGPHVEILTAAWPASGRGLDVGELEPGPVDRMLLSAFASDGRLVGYGAMGPMEVPKKGKVTLAVPFRRPLSYVAGGTNLAVFDTSRPKEEQLLDPLLIGTGSDLTTAVDGTPDGRHLLVTTQGPHQLHVVDTRTHSVTQVVDLPDSPTFLSVSQDSEWVVVSHYDTNEVTFVRLNDVLEGRGTSAQWTLGLTTSPGPAAVATLPGGQQVAAVLGGRLRIDFVCQPEPAPSTLHIVDLASRTLQGTVTLNEGARAIAATVDQSAVFVAFPCDSRAARLDPSNWQELDSDDLPAPTHLMATDTTLFVGNSSDAVGTGPSFQPAELSLNTVDLGNNVVNTLQMPFFKERIPLHTHTGGDALTLTLDPLTVRVFRMSVAPGETRISVLVVAGYYTTGFSVGQLTVPETNATSLTYVTVDRGSAEIVGRYRATCTVTLLGPNPDGLEANRCEDLESFSQPPSNQDFEPLGVTTLYGAP